MTYLDTELAESECGRTRKSLFDDKKVENDRLDEANSIQKMLRDQIMRRATHAGIRTRHSDSAHQQHRKYPR
jgi:hypothetical protein